MADILIIEDDEGLRKLLRKSLEADGHAVREACDGLEGVELTRVRLPDLVVTDLFMPEQDGIETIVQLREDYPDLRILVISGRFMEYGGSALVDAALLGADATLAKPFDRDRFNEAVRRLVGPTE